MNFSTNAAETGIFTIPPSQEQLMAKVFTPMEFASAAAATVAAPNISTGQHRYFVGEMCGSNNEINGNESRRFSYQPNGGSIKTAQCDLMPSTVPSGGRGFARGGFTSIGGGGGGNERGECDRGGGLSHSPTDNKCANGTPEGSSVQSSAVVGGPITFQELTALHTEPMDYALRGQASQPTSNCRKRHSVTQNTYSTEYFTNDKNRTTGEMLDRGQAPPPSASDFCYSPENSSQQDPGTPSHMMSQLSHRSSSPPAKPEARQSKRYHFDVSMIRRSGRLTQAQIQPQHRHHHQQQQQQQQQQQYVASQKYFFDASASHGQLNSDPTIEAADRNPNAAWGQKTRQQQLATVNNPRWRLQHIVSSPASPVVEEQQLPLPIRKTSLCTVRHLLTGRMALTPDQPADGVDIMMEPSPRAAEFDTMLATTESSKAFDFSLSRDLLEPPSTRVRKCKPFSRSNNYNVDNKEEDLGVNCGAMEEGNSNNDSAGEIDSSHSNNLISSAIPTSYFTPKEFNFFDEPFKSTWKDVKLVLLQQPELQHRARYLTEGSRGPIKNRTFDGYPTIQLQGWTGPAVVQVFVAIEPSDPHLHMFYQACIVSTKTNRGCSELIFGFTTVVQLPFTPNSESRVMSVDSIGLVKLRNSDVERRMASLSEEQQKKLLCFPGVLPPTSTSNSNPNGRVGHPPSMQICDEITCRSIKPKSSSARLVYRVLLLSDDNRVKGVVQVISDPIRCTQIVGGPEICRMSIKEADVRSQPELFIIGKNFVRGTRVIFRQLASSMSTIDDPPTELYGKEKIDVIWEKDAIVDPNLFYQTHLICKVPEYSGPSLPLASPLQIQVCIETPTKAGRPETFTYLPSLPLRGPPAITRLSHREAPMCGLLNLVILGSNFSLDCRVLFRQIIVATDISATCTLPRVFEETNMIWQREALVDIDFLTSSHLVCRVPPYDGKAVSSLSPLQVQIFILSPSGTSDPENFYYVQNSR